MTRNEREMWTVMALLLCPTVVAAQGSVPPTDSTAAEIRTSLRSFYYNLGRRDWEALAADVLPAKVVAHRPAPEAFVRNTALPAAARSPACSSGAGPAIDRAAIVFAGDWAEVSVPGCVMDLATADEFRLIHFQARWRIVYIALHESPASVSSLPH
jgi:hypothetical protein